MVLLLLVALVAPLIPTAPVGSAPDAKPCRAALPQGPSVPAPIVFRNSCGVFRLRRDGDVMRLPPGWLASRSGGTGRRYGADLRIQRDRPGRIVLRRHGAVVWRSASLYRNDAGSVAFGPGAFAFSAYRRGIFLTDLRSPERVIVPGVGHHPLAFLRDGSLLVVEGGAGAIRLVARDGSVLRRYPYRRQNGYQIDERTESLFLVTPRRMLVRAHGTAVRVLRPLGDSDGWVGFAGVHVTLSDEESLAVLRRDGSLLSSWSWHVPRGSRLDLSPVASEDGRKGAFRTVPADGQGSVVLYVLREGQKQATAVYRHRGVQVGCGVGASFDWQDDFLLYSATDGPTTLVDARTGSVQSLAELTARLPRRFPGERALASWASDFPTPSSRSR
jgi:hypothetical protein